MKSLLCPKCGKAPTVEHSYGVIVHCDDCYDVDCTGDPPTFTTKSLQGVGMSMPEAVEAWNEAVEDFIADRDYVEEVPSVGR